MHLYVAARACPTLPLVGGVPSLTRWEKWFEKQSQFVEEPLKQDGQSSPGTWLSSNLGSHGAASLKIVEASDMFQDIHVSLGALN